MQQNKIKRTKKYAIIIGVCLLIGISIATLSNISLRKEWHLNEEQERKLLKVFPEDHLKKIRFYEGGILAIGSTKVVCNAVYINQRTSYSFFENQTSPTSITLLVHETTHTWQNRKGCLTNSIEALESQFQAYLLQGDRNYAYVYSLNTTLAELNPEQEATVIEDYYWLVFENGSISETYCYDCKEDTENLREQFSMKVNEILDAYR